MFFTLCKTKIKLWAQTQNSFFVNRFATVHSKNVLVFLCSYFGQRGVLIFFSSKNHNEVRILRKQLICVRCSSLPGANSQSPQLMPFTSHPSAISQFKLRSISQILVRIAQAEYYLTYLTYILCRKLYYLRLLELKKSKLLELKKGRLNRKEWRERK